MRVVLGEEPPWGRGPGEEPPWGRGPGRCHLGGVVLGEEPPWGRGPGRRQLGAWSWGRSADSGEGPEATLPPWQAGKLGPESTWRCCLSPSLAVNQLAPRAVGRVRGL